MPHNAVQEGVLSAPTRVSRPARSLRRRTIFDKIDYCM